MEFVDLWTSAVFEVARLPSTDAPRMSTLTPTLACNY